MGEQAEQVTPMPEQKKGKCETVVVRWANLKKEWAAPGLMATQKKMKRW